MRSSVLYTKRINFYITFKFVEKNGHNELEMSDVTTKVKNGSMDVVLSPALTGLFHYLLGMCAWPSVLIRITITVRKHHIQKQPGRKGFILLRVPHNS